MPPTSDPSHEAGLRLRAASASDAERLREWRNDPEVRAASRNTGEVGREEHEAWLAGVLADPDRRLLICELGGQPVGQVRLDRLGEGRYEISVSLAAEARGRGLSSRAIELGVERLRRESPGAEVEAHVREGNDRSLSAFERAGFRRSDRRGEEGFLVLVSRAGDQGLSGASGAA